ncbi:dTMP kinase [Periweissella fabaria]|uniref:Thymidylate kinase n=1 Tax=Periweissella fabaria TaxID=546157 RepID=A0ABM8Z558_9LACO|nr:dTMP kinase [Periweissella fabaria]MCM0596582.1 dTMP kinase [Periweissella fabaria]CAH0416493.1 Thymidylate kinase [Periweissella fabaria]
MKESGILISFEGPDGAGKTSVLRRIMQRLTPILGDRLLFTREPGGTNNKTAESIRELVLNSSSDDMDDRTEVLLFAAARRQHVVQTILPALEDGKIVITDRYVDSSVAYQGGGREIGMDTVIDINKFAIEGTLPDYTIYFNVRPEIGIQRIKNTRMNEVNRLDEETLAFHQRVSESYLIIANDNPERFKIINADNDIDDVVEETWQVIQTILQTKL